MSARRFQGVTQILRFNWHWYALALAVNAAAWGFFRLGPYPLLGKGMALAAGFGTAWMILSLLVSYAVYDLSGLREGRWLGALGAISPRRVVVLHTGHDEASGPARLRWSGADLQVFDLFDERRPAEVSLLRARAAAPSRAPSAPVGALPLPSGSVDLVCGVFSLHELRHPEDRATLFREIRRVLNHEGALVLVEHLRDPWNVLAYGPGGFHFLSRRTWNRAFAQGGLQIKAERPYTPFVRLFLLEPTP